MQEAVPAGVGAMAAILGLEDHQVVNTCAEVANGQIVAAANFNAPGQVVIAGDTAAVERAMEALKALGAKTDFEIAGQRAFALRSDGRRFRKAESKYCKTSISKCRIPP